MLQSFEINTDQEDCSDAPMITSQTSLKRWKKPTATLKGRGWLVNSMPVLLTSAEMGIMRGLGEMFGPPRDHLYWLYWSPISDQRTEQPEKL